MACQRLPTSKLKLPRFQLQSFLLSSIQIVLTHHFFIIYPPTFIWDKLLMNFELNSEWLVVSNFLTNSSYFQFYTPSWLLKLKFQLPSFPKIGSQFTFFCKIDLQLRTFFKISFQLLNFFRNQLLTSNFFQIRLPTSNFFQNRLPTSNFLPNRLPTSNFSTIIEGGTVPPSIAYFCSPDLNCESDSGKLTKNRSLLA